MKKEFTACVIVLIFISILSRCFLKTCQIKKIVFGKIMHRAKGVKMNTISVEISKVILKREILIYIIPKVNAVAIDESLQSILFSGLQSKCVF